MGQPDDKLSASKYKAMNKTKGICTPGGNPDESFENPHSYEVGPMDSGEDHTLLTAEMLKNLSLTNEISEVEVDHEEQLCTKRLTKTDDLSEEKTTVGGSNVAIELEELVGTKRSVATDCSKGKTPDGSRGAALHQGISQYGGRFKR